MVHFASLLACAATSLALPHREGQSHYDKRQTSYRDLVLYHHNAHRANHSAPPLEYDYDLENSAAQAASSCQFTHFMNINGGSYGQNIAAGVFDISQIISDMWYNSEVSLFSNLYGQAYPDMSLFPAWGHFSQVVWKGTRRVGCATQVCERGVLGTGGLRGFTVCNYRGAGNIAGAYADNVGVSLEMADVFGLSL